MEPELIPQSDNGAQLEVPVQGTDPEPAANDMKSSLAVALTDPPHPISETDASTNGVDHGHHGNGTHANGNGVHVNGNGVYANGHATNGHATNGHSTNGHATNGHLNGVNGHASVGTNGTNGHHVNGNGHLNSALALSGYRHGAAASALNGYARVAYAEPMPSDLPVSLPWLGRGEADPSSLYLRFGKRALDVAIAGVGLAVLSPVFLALAAVVKLSSRGPVFYKSERLGRLGRPFTFYKFRSMYVGAHEDRHKVAHLNEKKDGPVFKIFCDPRTTRIGRFLRQTSLDELPQLAHVLRGDMTLVGPRPPLPEEVAKYESWHRRRLEVKPGLTCLWQISGRSRLGFNEWMRLDLEYIKRQSFATDAKILLRTIPAVVSREGAY